jgi:hypothetical protein
MPYYVYHCASNGRTLEVRHGMDDRVRTWEELAERAGASLGETPADAPVERLMSAPVPLTGTGSEAAGARAAAPQGGCGPGCACAARS